jgi:hypothetical protein
VSAALFDETVSAFDLLPEDPGTGGTPAARSGVPVLRGDGAVPNSGGIHVPERGDTLYNLFGNLAEGAGASPALAARPASGSPHIDTSQGSAVPPPPAPPIMETWPFSGLVPETSAQSGGPTRREIKLVSLITAGALAVLVAIFFLGMHLAAGAAPTAAPSTPAAPHPRVTALPSVMHASGTAGWQTLAGGECFTPFTSGWVRTFTVVDCAGPHQAQLVYATLLPGTTSDAYPGAAKVVSNAQKICGQNGVIDLAAAHDDVGVQVQATYPVDERQWDSGQRAVYCFATLSSGDSIVGSIAGKAAGDASPTSGH